MGKVFPINHRDALRLAARKTFTFICNALFCASPPPPCPVTFQVHFFVPLPIAKTNLSACDTRRFSAVIRTKKH